MAAGEGVALEMYPDARRRCDPPIDSENKLDSTKIHEILRRGLTDGRSLAAARPDYHEAQRRKRAYLLKPAAGKCSGLLGRALCTDEWRTGA